MRYRWTRLLMALVLASVVANCGGGGGEAGGGEVYDLTGDWTCTVDESYGPGTGQHIVYHWRVVQTGSTLVILDQHDQLHQGGVSGTTYSVEEHEAGQSPQPPHEEWVYVGTYVWHMSSPDLGEGTFSWTEREGARVFSGGGTMTLIPGHETPVLGGE